MTHAQTDIINVMQSKEVFQNAEREKGIEFSSLGAFNWLDPPFS